MIFIQKTKCLLIIMLLVVGCTLTAAAYETRTLDGRTYLFETPQDTCPENGWPIVMLFHPAIVNAGFWFADRIELTQMLLNNGFAVVAPEAKWLSGACPGGRLCWIPGYRWNQSDMPTDDNIINQEYDFNDDLVFVHDLLTLFESDVTLDHSQVFLSGYSSGCAIVMMASAVFRDLYDFQIKAGVINAAGYPNPSTGSLDLYITNDHPPILINHGLHDKIHDEQGAVDYFNDLCLSDDDETPLVNCLNVRMVCKGKLLKRCGHAWIDQYNDANLEWFEFFRNCTTPPCVPDCAYDCCF